MIATAICIAVVIVTYVFLLHFKKVLLIIVTDLCILLCDHNKGVVTMMVEVQKMLTFDDSAVNAKCNGGKVRPIFLIVC